MVHFLYKGYHRYFLATLSKISDNFIKTFGNLEPIFLETAKLRFFYILGRFNENINLGFDIKAKNILENEAFIHFGQFLL